MQVQPQGPRRRAHALERCTFSPPACLNNWPAVAATGTVFGHWTPRRQLAPNQPPRAGAILTVAASLRALRPPPAARRHCARAGIEHARPACARESFVLRPSGARRVARALPGLAHAAALRVTRQAFAACEVPARSCPSVRPCRGVPRSTRAPACTEILSRYHVSVSVCLFFFSFEIMCPCLSMIHACCLMQKWTIRIGIG